HPDGLWMECTHTAHSTTSARRACTRCTSGTQCTKSELCAITGADRKVVRSAGPNSDRTGAERHSTMFHTSSRPWARTLRSVRPGSAFRAPGSGGIGRILHGLDVLSLVMQLIQMLPPLWAAALLVGIGTWIASLIAVALVATPATWWLLRRRPRREL